MLRRLIGAAAIACLALPASSAPVRVRLADGVTSAHAIAGTIACGTSKASFTLTATETTVELPPCAEPLAFHADGWWGATSATDPGVVLLWPRAKLTGTLDGTATAVKIRIESDGRFAPVTDSCELRERVWECAAPAGVPLHVRVAADDAIPHYFFDVTAPRDLGAQQLVRGASIAGFVDIRDAVVELTAEGKRIASRKVNAHGFFQFADVPRGALIVAARGASPIELRITSTTETALPARLRAVPLATFELSITPPADSNGLPWRVELARRGRDQSAILLRRVVDGTASPDGGWNARGLEPGEYALSIRDSAGSVQHTQDVTIEADAAPLLVAVHQVPVRGRVTLGGEPIEAKVMFNGAVEIESNRDGEFEGALPKEGEWNITVHPAGTRQLLRRRAVEVHRAEGAEHARIDLDFPGGRIEGEVVDESGRAVAANLTLVRDGRLDTSGGTEEDGTFSIVGLQPGNVLLVADAKEGTSEPVACTIERDRKTNVRVVVLKRMNLDARIETRGGAPIAGAVVSYFAPTFLERRESVSGLSGRIELELPSKTPRVTLVVLAPGFARKLLTLPVEERMRARVVLGESTGILRVRFPGGGPWPWIRTGGTDFVSLASLYVPGRMHEVIDRRGFFAGVEPGEYTICPAPGLSDRCRTAVIAAGGETLVDTQ